MTKQYLTDDEVLEVFKRNGFLQYEANKNKGEWFNYIPDENTDRELKVLLKENYKFRLGF